MNDRFLIAGLAAATTMLAHFVFPSPSLAQTEKMILMVTLHGKCWLKLTGKEMACSPKLMNSNYPGGRTGFYISGVDESVYTWSGAGGHKSGPNSQVLEVDQFIISSNGKTTGFPAKGTCHYQNPYQGKPTQLKCKASYGNRTAEFRFEHDGAQPIEDKVPAP
jgi:hypothetical protein